MHYRSLSVPARAFAVAAGLTLSAVAAHAAPGWNESIDGDLSNDRLAPSAVLLGSGSNFVTGTTVSGDRDYFTITLGSGQSLAALVLTSYVSADNVAFAAIQAGSTFTEPPTGTNPANLLGYAHIGTANIGDDVLPLIGAGAGSIGFTPPLTGSSYSFWVQQTGASLTSYTLDLQVVPEPGVWGLLGGALAVCVALICRFRRGRAQTLLPSQS